MVSLSRDARSQAHNEDIEARHAARGERNTIAALPFPSVLKTTGQTTAQFLKASGTVRAITNHHGESTAIYTGGEGSS